MRKPGTSIDNPEYYTPADFAIGATIEVFSRKFQIVGEFVLLYDAHGAV